MLLLLVVLLPSLQGTYTSSPESFQFATCDNLVSSNEVNSSLTSADKRHRDVQIRALSAPPSLADLLDQDEPNKFSIKHVYKDYKPGMDSYAELSRSPEAVKSYLLELNRNMFKGNILPCSVDGPQTYNTWIKNAGDAPKRITLIDADLADIAKDIGEQASFKAYHERNMKDPNNKELPFKDNLFTTTKKYPITDIILKMEGDELHVSLERHVVQVELGMKNTEVFHFEKPLMATASGSMQTGKFATLTKQQLKQIDARTQQFWKKFLGTTKLSTVKIGTLKLDTDKYRQVEADFKEKFEAIITSGSCSAGGSRRRKRSGGKCAFYLSGEGEIESIRPEEFLEVYEETGQEGRRRMTNVVKNNGDKIISTDESNLVVAKRKLNQLVHHQEMTVHAELVETTGRIQDFRRWISPVPSKASEMVTAIHAEVATQMNQVRLSGTKVVYNLAKNPHITNINKAGKSYGHLMLAKGMINGILHDDKTALAVLGSRVGYDIVTEGTVKLGTKLFSTASKLGRSAKVLGKVAGPIGGLIDVGLGAWSLSKSVDRLRDATNKYDRDDAIASIVSDSIDMTVGIATTVLSVAFPPAAPFIFAVGLLISVVNSFATAMFQAGNEVARINSKIPLLDFEKVHVFSSRALDIFGLREKDYIDYLVEEQAANDLAVQSYLDFLKKNKQFMGVLFPSRALQYDGGCYLKKYHCPIGTWLGRPMCTWWEILGYQCDWNGPCTSSGRSCTNEQTSTEFYDCICKSDNERGITEFGVAHRDSSVDFTSRQSVYWERAVPGDVSGVDFKCKPSSLEYLDHRIHQSQSRVEYFCYHAIGMYRPSNEIMDGQSFLVNLEDGTDKVDIDQERDTTPYTYWLGEEGHKVFKGGSGRNDFILNGNCTNGLLSGILYGGPKSSDSLIIAPNCAPGETINIQYDTSGSRLPVSTVKGSKLDLRLERIENIIGRPNEAESVNVGCDTRGVFLNGASSSGYPDTILIPSQHYCPVNVQTVLSNYTNFISNAAKGDVTVYVGKEMAGSRITINAPESYIGSQNGPITTIIFTQTNSEQIVLDGIRTTHSDVSLRLKDHPSRDPLILTFSLPARISPSQIVQYQLLFNESSAAAPGIFSSLMVPGNDKFAKESPLMFYHNLQSKGKQSEQNVRYVGNNAVPNLFNLSSAGWSVHGGTMEDTFILKTPIHELELDGADGDDVLVIGSRQTDVIMMDNNLRIRGIESVVATENVAPVEISTACDTKAVVVKSDDVDEPTIVRIGKCDEVSRELQIDAGGATLILIDGDINGENEIVRVLAHSTPRKPVMFELDTQGHNVSKMLVQVEIPQFSDLSVTHMGRSEDLNTFRVKITGMDSGHAIFNLRMHDDGTDAFISSPQIQLIQPKKQPSQLVFERDTLEPVVVHVVDENTKEKNVRGMESLHNLFRISEGSKSNYKYVYGGEVKDTFVGTPAALSSTTLYAQSKSDNTLVIVEAVTPESPDVPFKIDLQTGQIGSILEETDKLGHIEGSIQHVLGRENQPDVITAGCATKTISGRGGPSADTPDLIIVPPFDKCRDDNMQDNMDAALELHLGPFTKIENLAEKGAFKYFVDLTKSADYINFSLHPNRNNSHKVLFTLPPQLQEESPVQIQSIKFDRELETMSIQAVDHTSGESTYQFKMSREDEQSDYLNPKLLFTSSTGNYTITSDVRADRYGLVNATYLLTGSCTDWSNYGNVFSGFPAQINNFLININGGGNINCGGIRGSDGALENRFWLYEMPLEARFQIVGVAEAKVNTLHLDKDFHGEKAITTILHSGGGAILRDGVEISLDLKRINIFEGRNNSNSVDTIIPACDTKQVSGVDIVKVVMEAEFDCAYDLIIGMDRTTRVLFEWIGNEESAKLTDFGKSKFNYRLNEPMSFEVAQSHAGILNGTVHNIYLPFDFEDVEALKFDSAENKLQYTFDGKPYWITMISQPGDEDQFYPQPNIITSDGFAIKVTRDKSILVTRVLTGGQREDDLFYMIQENANRLGVTILAQTETSMIHVGNDIESDRNVLQNVGHRESYLGGGGARNTIYEIVNLNKDVYITTGLELLITAPSTETETATDANRIKQTLDLTDIVTPIRITAGHKYKPKVVQSGDDLIVSMNGYEKDYPGRIVIFGGAKENVHKNLQVLLSNAMMELLASVETAESPNAWKLSPVDVHLERETIYSIAAEDLEYDHKIVVLDHKYGPEYQFRFNYSQNGDDLHLSDIEGFKEHKYDKQHIEMTTVIITDFYKNFGNVTENREVASGNLPAEIMDVTLFLPGLKIKLNGSDVLLLSNESKNIEMASEVNYLQNQSVPMIRKFSSMVLPPKMPVLLTSGMLPKWTGVLHEIENAILDDLPFEQRNY